MRIRVLAFGVLRELLPSADFCLDVPSPCTVGELASQLLASKLIDNLANEHPSPAASLTDIWPSIALAVNRDYVDRTRPLADGDELALLPPVSGGSAISPANPHIEPPIALTHNVIDTAAILATVRHPEDGAVALFDGIVRNHTRSRKTRFLVYESYDEMALRQMQQLVAEARQRFPIHEIALVHRLGKIEIGESSVLIAVCSAHRAAAFDACRWLIDTLKKTVPIWKQEHFEDGAVWAPGEPFPPEIVPEP